jgi:hypothetical protein
VPSANTQSCEVLPTLLAGASVDFQIAGYCSAAQFAGGSGLTHEFTKSAFL